MSCKVCMKNVKDAKQFIEDVFIKIQNYFYNNYYSNL